MKKKYIFLIIILIILFGLIFYYLMFSNKKVREVFKQQSENDASIVKKEYESLNGTTYTYKGVTYDWSNVNIDKNNNMVALKFDEVMDLLNNKTGILYFSRPSCPWCRLMTPILIDFSNDIDENVYYYNVVPDRNENNTNYQTLVSKLYDILPVDTYTQSKDDPNFDETKHGMVQPMLFFIKDGKVVSYIYAFQHEYLQNNEIQKMYDLIGKAYEKMDN